MIDWWLRWKRKPAGDIGCARHGVSLLSLSEVQTGNDLNRPGLLVVHDADASAELLADIKEHAEHWLGDRSAAVLDAARFFDNEYWQVPALASAHLPRILVVRTAAMGTRGRTQLVGLIRSGDWSSLPAISLSHGEAHDLLARHSQYYYQTSILISDYCNLKCRMCMFHSEDEETFHYKAERLPRDKELLDTAICGQFLDQLPAGTKVLVSAAGEVFVHKQAPAVLKQVADRGLIPIVITNGQLLDSDKIDLLIRSGVRQVIVSIDSIDPVSYGNIRVGGELIQAVGNVEQLRKRTKEAGSDLRITINSVMFEENSRNKDAVISYWSSRADELTFLAERLDHFGRPRAILTEKSPDIPYCFAPMEGPLLLADGGIAPCCSVAICSWFEPMPWLLNVKDVPVAEAVAHYRRMLLAPSSPLRTLCSRCHYGANSYWHESRSPFSETFVFQTDR